MAASRTERIRLIRDQLRRTAPLWLVMVMMWTTACATATPIPTASPTTEPTPRPPTPTPTPPERQQRLIICATEPQAASPFRPSQSGSDLLALFYEEPIERARYQWQPRLVTDLPTFDNAGVITRVVTVREGTRYADPLGFVRTFTATDPLELPQMVVSFTLASGLQWSDGISITAQDAVLGYHLAQSPQAEGRWRTLVERTARFTAIDDLTLRWEGIPGYLDADYAGFMFPLQPAHRWQGQTLLGILDDRTPPASGPFKITAWVSGREIRLIPNPYFHGPPPVLEEVVMRFPQQSPSTWGKLLIDGTCDVLLPDPIVLTAWDRWAQLGAAGEAIVWADAAPSFLRLDINLAPVRQEQDDTDEEAEPYLLAEAELRRALGACINRDLLAETMPAEALTPALGFIPPSHPAITETTQPTYRPSTARTTLQELGWRDDDLDGIREAHDIPDIRDGRNLSLKLHFASAYFSPAAHIAADLEACGFDIQLHPTDRRQLYAVDAASPLFGRQFELALIGWRANVPGVCGTWFSHRIPTEENDWLGENFSGFASEDYDAACKRALSALTLEEQRAALAAAQGFLNEALPTIFLAWRPFWFVSRPDVTGIEPDASAYGTLWNSEEIAIQTENVE